MTTSNYRIATIHKGTYAAGTAYVPNDEVSYGTPASTYRNKLACTGVVPTNTTNWVLVAQAGATGATGVDATSPVGTIIFYAKNTPPNGYLKCNGALLSRTTYASLFGVIGTAFGEGDGSTTFALPDLRGEFIRGWDDGRGVDAGRGIATNQNDDFKAHDHLMATWNGTVGNYEIGGSTTSYGVDFLGGVPHTSVTGGSETRPRNIALLPCIKY